MQLERGTDNDMRILLVATTLTAAGLGSRVLDLAKALGRKGLDVAVASDTPETDVPVQELNRLGIAHYSVPLGRGASVTLARSVRALRRIILTRNIGLIHAFGPVLAWIAAMARRGMGPVQLVVSLGSCGQGGAAQDGRGQSRQGFRWPLPSDARLAESTDPDQLERTYAALLASVGRSLYPKEGAGLEEET